MDAKVRERKNKCLMICIKNLMIYTKYITAFLQKIYKLKTFEVDANFPLCFMQAWSFLRKRWKQREEKQTKVQSRMEES